RNIYRVAVLLLVVGQVVAQNQAASTSFSARNSILNLYDAFGYQKKGTILDWGFSALIHYNGKTILFDTGNSADGFEHNVKALGVDLKQVDMAVLSHRHYDHISGHLIRLPLRAAFGDRSHGPVDLTFNPRVTDKP